MLTTILCHHHRGLMWYDPTSIDHQGSSFGLSGISGAWSMSAWDRLNPGCWTIKSVTRLGALTLWVVCYKRLIEHSMQCILSSWWLLMLSAFDFSEFNCLNGCYFVLFCFFLVFSSFFSCMFLYFAVFVCPGVRKGFVCLGCCLCQSYCSIITLINWLIDCRSSRAFCCRWRSHV